LTKSRQNIYNISTKEHKMNVNQQLLSALAGIALSLAFSYIPGLNARFQALDGQWKRVALLGTLAVVSAGIYGLSCGGIVDAVSCDQAGAIGLVQAFVLALVANQSAYQLTPPARGGPA
jgi:hypothetical protein